MDLDQLKLSLLSLFSEEEVEVGNDLITNLPREIILNIISRLPFDSVLECKVVCKAWRILVNNDTYFAYMHLQHNYEHDQYNFDETETKISLVFLDKNIWLNFVEYVHNNKHCTQKRMTLPLPDDTATLIGSCNGLICLSVNVESEVFSKDSVYICNPISREFLHLPIVNDKHERIVMAYGFGYHPSTKVYKVVRVYYCYDRSNYKFSMGQVQVYTLGSGIGWRSIGETEYYLLRHGVLLNGALHWITDGENVVAFDLADEEFRCLPRPPLTSSSFLHSIGVLGGLLCLVDRRAPESSDLWLLKKKEKQSASSSFDDTKEHVYHSWSWSLECTIEIPDDCLNQPFAITRTGEILVWQGGKNIVCFDPKATAQPEMLEDFRLDLVANRGKRRNIYFSALAEESIS